MLRTGATQKPKASLRKVPKKSEVINFGEVPLIFGAFLSILGFITGARGVHPHSANDAYCIFTPNFHKIYKFLPYFRKMYKFSPIFVQFTFLLTMMHVSPVLDAPDRSGHILGV